MSFEGNWPIHGVPSADDLANLLQDVARQAGLDPPEVTIETTTRILEVLWEVPVAGAERIPSKLNEHTCSTFDEIRQDLDPPNERVDEAAAAAAGLVERKVGSDGVERVWYLPGYERFEGIPSTYHLLVEVVPGDDDLGPLVRVFSNSCDNREGWPVACALGLAVAERCGIDDSRWDEVE